MQNPPPVQTGKSSTGLDENVASLLSYLLGWISGLVFFLIEKDSRLVRFHAMQSILLSVTIGVFAVVVGILIAVFVAILSAISSDLGGIVALLSSLLWLAFGLVILLLWVMCLIKAFQGQMYKLPIIGKFAEQFSAPK